MRKTNNSRTSWPSALHNSVIRADIPCFGRSENRFQENSSPRFKRGCQLAGWQFRESVLPDQISWLRTALMRSLLFFCGWLPWLVNDLLLMLRCTPFMYQTHSLCWAISNFGECPGVELGEAAGKSDICKENLPEPLAAQEAYWKVQWKPSQVNYLP